MPVFRAGPRAAYGRNASLSIRRVAAGSNGMGELGVLGRGEPPKRKRRLPVRKLVVRIPNLIQKLKPVFMMSPLAVSQVPPHGVNESDTLAFDSVIFDEASQVFPEDAIPAISRGRQCIVVGDQQQLPPSSFFRKGEADNDGTRTTMRLQRRIGWWESRASSTFWSG